MRPLAVLIGCLAGLFAALALPWWGSVSVALAWALGIVVTLVAQHHLGNSTHSVSGR